MQSRCVRVFRGWVWLGRTPEESWPDYQRWGQAWRYPVTRWHERSFDAHGPLDGPRCAAVRNACQTASGGSYFVFLGAVYIPGPAGSLRVTVAEGPDLDGLPPHDAVPVFERLVSAVEAWPERPSGEIRIDHAAHHPADDKVWAWEAAAASLGLLLRPGVEAMSDAEIQDRIAGFFRGG